MTQPRPNDLPRVLGPWSASAIMIGVIIGSGIFQTPAEAAKHLGSPYAILGFWVLGGVLSLFGALIYSELACLYPQSGGVYVFIREAYGRCAAFVFGWSYMLLIKPLAAGGIAVVFTSHLQTLLHAAFPGAVPPAGTEMFPHAAQAITCAMLLVLTFINVMGVRLGANVATLLTSIKFLALAAIVILPVLVGAVHPANFASTPAPESFLHAIAPVLAAVLWTFDGWADVGAIAGEVENPQQNLPKIYIRGTLAVTALYLAVNVSFMLLVPLTEMRTQDTIAPLAFERLLGPGAGLVVAAVIVLSTAGATHASIMTGARVTYQQARDGLLFSPLGRVSRRETPGVSLWVQLALSCLAVIFFKYFAALTSGYVFTIWIYYGLGAFALFVFRWKHPDAPRAFRVPWYPFIPVVFILAALGMTILTIAGDFSPGSTDRFASLRFLGIMALGVPAFYIWEKQRRRLS